MSLIEIARDRRLGKQTVRRLLFDAGVRIRRRGLDKAQVQHAIQTYESGLTTREIATDLQVGHSMVWRALIQAGVQTRPNIRRPVKRESKGE